MASREKKEYEGIVIQLQTSRIVPESGQSGEGGFAIVRLIGRNKPRFVKLYFRPSEFRIAADALVRGVPVKFKGDCFAPNIGDYNAALIGDVAGRLRGAELFDWAFSEVESDEIATSKAMGNGEEYIAGLRRGLKEAFEVAQLAVIKEFDLKEFNVG